MSFSGSNGHFNVKVQLAVLSHLHLQALLSSFYAERIKNLINNVQPEISNILNCLIF